jgi:hypothetical protein
LGTLASSNMMLRRKNARNHALSPRMQPRAVKAGSLRMQLRRASVRRARRKEPASDSRSRVIRPRSQDRRIPPLPISDTRNRRSESERTPARTPGVFRGTASSNPAPSSRESGANCGCQISSRNGFLAGPSGGEVVADGAGVPGGSGFDQRRGAGPPQKTRGGPAGSADSRGVDSSCVEVFVGSRGPFAALVSVEGSDPPGIMSAVDCTHRLMLNPLTSAALCKVRATAESQNMTAAGAVAGPTHQQVAQVST